MRGRGLYSLGLDVMGAVIERVTGQVLDRFLRERFFQPLGMKSTGFQVAARDVGRLTNNYWSTPDGTREFDAAATSSFLEPPRLPSGGGGLVTTARDFTRFGQMLLGAGALGRVRILEAETVRRAMSNLLPPGVTTAAGGHGAGARVVLPGQDALMGLPGTFGWAAGAAGTIWRVDPAAQVQVLFMMQHMPPHPFDMFQEVPPAVAADRAG